MWKNPYCANNYTDLDDVEIQLGDLVEIYAEDDEIYKIVIIRYTYDTIDYIEDEDDIDDCYIETEEGYEMCYDDSMNFSTIYATADEGDDILLVVDESDNIVYAEWPTIVSGDITTVYTDSYLKMDGTTYYLTANAGTPDVTDDDDTSIIYLNQYGYVVYCDTTDTSNNDNAVAVIKTYSSLNSDSEIVDMAKVVYSDGSTEGVAIGSVDNASGHYPDSGSYDAYVGGFYTFDEDDDEYDLTAAISNNNDADTLVLVDTIPVSAYDYDPFSSSSRYYFQDTTVTGYGYSYYYYDSDVYFIFVDTDDNDVTVYEGVTSYTVDAGASAEVMIVLDDDRERIVAVFVVGTADGETADDVVYIDGTKTGSMSLNGDVYYTYDAYLDGDEIDDFYADTSSAGNGFFEYSIGDDGEYELSSVNSNYVTGDDEEYAYCANLTIEEIVDSRYLLFTDDGTNGVFGTGDFNMASAEIWNFATDDNINTAAKLQALWDKTQDSTSDYYQDTIQVAVVGETEDYTLSAVYITGITEYVPSSNTEITNITSNVSGIEIDADSNVGTITITGATQNTYKMSDATISLADDNASVTAIGTDSITVTAENGTPQTYNITRYYGQTDGVELTFTTDNATKVATATETVSSGDTTLSFNNDVYVGDTISVSIVEGSNPYNVKEVSITSGSPITEAKDKYSITVQVTADNGTTTDNYTYTFTTVAVATPNSFIISDSNDISTTDETSGSEPAADSSTSNETNGTTENNNANTQEPQQQEPQQQEPQQQQQQQEPQQQQQQQQPQEVIVDDSSSNESSTETTTASSVTDGVTLTFSVTDTALTTTAVTSGTGGSLTFEGTLPNGASITVASDNANNTTFSYSANGNMVIVTITAQDGTTGRYVYTIPNGNTSNSSSMNNLRR